VTARTPTIARSEYLWFVVPIGLIALHVADDSFFQPQPGTGVGDHLVSGLVPLGALGLAAWAYPRLRSGFRATIALVLGLFGVVAGVEGVYYTTKGGPSGDDFTGLLALAAGVVLIAGGVAAVYVVLGPFYLSYVFTHVARGFVPTADLGAAHQDVTFTTSDGLELRGWYIPSKNRAAVIVFPGRKGPQRQTRMLARHGYGVLLFDRRGEGESDGDPNALGWAGERDLNAAVAFLRRRPDVDPDRIGGIGLSVGGEMMIEAAAESDGLKAIVSEGAGIRSLREALAIPGTKKRLEAAIAHVVVTPGVALFSNDAPPASLEDLVGRIAPRPVFLIYAVPGQGGEAELSEAFYDAARGPKTIWRVPGSGHTGGIEARPEEYERRVVRFFDGALLQADEGGDR
jgi:hypothetical protein